MPRKRPPAASPSPTWHGVAGRMSATDVKNRFGEAVAEAERRGVVVVTRHDRPQVVLLSIGAYEALAGAALVDLGALETAFTARVARMQTPEHRAAVDTLFASGTRQVPRLS